MPDLSATAPSSSGTPLDITHLSPAGADGLAVSEASPVTPVAIRTPRKRTPKPPKDSKVYKVAMAVIALRAQGVKAKDIAETVGYSEETVRTYLKRANAKGWLNINSFSDPDDQLEYVLKSKTVRNVNEFLDERDKDVTIEAAKGLGMFKQHQVVKGDVAATIGVALKVMVEMPPMTSSPIAIRPGTVGGSPGADIPIDAEIIGAENQ